ncbi:hypothetical protein [Novosphingobium sp. TH158]|uniref:hypothetical protein n=1 Tax=Novosphingobium sp. TH158 TaxID=2067455 RepID=UPI000C7D475C|nr:hypothetical protein [Novosphingobium sp. TH158]PLK27609.1 hypothetical protein C0V78_12485 [Novosphingobium sp. TH158]
MDLFTGDATGLRIPAHPAALLAAGPEWLTMALRQFGSLAPDNAITAFTAEPCPGGSTGKKLFLTLETLRPEPGLDRVVFAKFSRDFDDERRDRQRDEMEGEARLVALSRGAQFPIRVPRGYFADYHADSGTGLVITERIAFGENGIEPHRRKCLDWQTMDGPLEYYSATVSALARLAAAHRSGALGADIEARFPWDPQVGNADPIRQTRAELAAQIAQCRAFARDCPHLMPPALSEPAFLDRMEQDAWLVYENDQAIRGFLAADPRLISLNHWNSNIDNAWFWREHGTLHCGLIDWGRFGQITFGAALWGGLCAAHHDIWQHHLDRLLSLFVAQYHAHGGPRVTLVELRQHLHVHMALMGTARMLAAPEVIRFRMPECVTASGPRDPMFLPVSADPARNYTSIYTALMLTWEREDFGATLREILGQALRA